MLDSSSLNQNISFPEREWMSEHMWKWTEVVWCRHAQQNPTMLLIMLLGAQRDKIMPSLSKPTKREENLQHTLLVRAKCRDNECRQARVQSCRWPPTGEELHVRVWSDLLPNHVPAQGGLGWPYMHVQCRPPLLHRAVSNSDKANK